MKKMVEFAVILLLLGLAASACALDLNRQTVNEPDKLPGVFTAVLIGGTFAADAERVAIFDLEGDSYHFRPRTPVYNFRRIEGLSAPKALTEAENHFSSHCAYNGYRVKSLKLDDDTIVGYELIPDYPPALCEWGNTVTVGYKVGADGEIKVYTNLLLPDDGDGNSFGKIGAPREKAAR